MVVVVVSVDRSKRATGRCERPRVPAINGTQTGIQPGGGRRASLDDRGTMRVSPFLPRAPPYTTPPQSDQHGRTYKHPQPRVGRHYHEG